MRRHCLVSGVGLALVLTWGLVRADEKDAPQEPSKAFALRTSPERQKRPFAYGGNKRSEDAVAAGLFWLARHQAPDGSWKLEAFHKFTRDKPDDPWEKVYDDKASGQGRENDVAGTALGLLPFLGCGITHKPDQVKRPYDYSKTVDLGLKFLLARQAKNKDGDFDSGMYAHGLATMALCEAYGMTADPALEESAQKAIDFIVDAQDQESGGWRYVPKQGGDTSVTGWQMQALHLGKLAGLNVPDETLKAAKKWLDAHMSEDRGDYGYLEPPKTTRDSPASAMTAAGLLCREFLGWGPGSEGLQNGISRLKRVPPGARGNMYYYYYATQVLYHAGGEEWESWDPRIRDLLVKKQDDGTKAGRATDKGSWDPKGDAHGEVGGRVVITSLSLLTLEIHYRYPPLYQRPEKEK